MNTTTDRTDTTRLKVNEPSGTTRVLPFAGEDLLLGRERTCDLVVDDEQASRQHARLGHGPNNTIVITDLGSTNGTRLNGRRISSDMTVRVDDDIRIGSRHIRIVAEQDLSPVTVIEIPESGIRVEVPPAIPVFGAPSAPAASQSTASSPSPSPSASADWRAR